MFFPSWKTYLLFFQLPLLALLLADLCLHHNQVLLILSLKNHSFYKKNYFDERKLIPILLGLLIYAYSINKMLLPCSH